MRTTFIVDVDTRDSTKPDSLAPERWRVAESIAIMLLHRYDARTIASVTVTPVEHLEDASDEGLPYVVVVDEQITHDHGSINVRRAS